MTDAGARLAALDTVPALVTSTQLPCRHKLQQRTREDSILSLGTAGVPKLPTEVCILFMSHKLRTEDNIPLLAPSLCYLISGSNDRIECPPQELSGVLQV